MFDNLIEKYHGIKTKRANGEGGFTLIELLVVVVIIGILIAIAIPLYLNYQKGAKDKSAESDLKAAVTAVQQCYTDFGSKFPGAGTQGSAGGTMSFTLTGATPSTCTTTATSSDATVLTYSPTGAGTGPGFTLTAHNNDGNNKTYTYDSTTAAGGVIK